MSVDVRRRSPLLQIVQTDDALRGHFSAAQPSCQQTKQNCHDRSHDQQLDERERGRTREAPLRFANSLIERLPDRLNGRVALLMRFHPKVIPKPASVAIAQNPHPCTAQNPLDSAKTTEEGPGLSVQSLPVENWHTHSRSD